MQQLHNQLFVQQQQQQEWVHAVDVSWLKT
jgi:hypothetical protein